MIRPRARPPLARVSPRPSSPSQGRRMSAESGGSGGDALSAIEPAGGAGEGGIERSAASGGRPKPLETNATPCPIPWQDSWCLSLDSPAAAERRTVAPSPWRP